MTASVDSSPALRGLTSADVADRVSRGLVNTVDEHTSRSFAHIVRANVLTRFNAILGTLMVLVLATGYWQDATFGIVMIANSLIGIVQETRAKRKLDRLAVLSAPKATIRRDGVSREAAVDEIVLDDVLEIKAGDQVPADGEVNPRAVAPAIVIGAVVAALVSVTWQLATPRSMLVAEDAGPRRVRPGSGVGDDQPAGAPSIVHSRWSRDRRTASGAE